MKFCQQKVRRWLALRPLPASWLEDTIKSDTYGTENADERIENMQTRFLASLKMWKNNDIRANFATKL